MMRASKRKTRPMSIVTSVISHSVISLRNSPPFGSSTFGSRCSEVYTANEDPRSINSINIATTHVMRCAKVGDGFVSMRVMMRSMYTMKEPTR